MKIDKNEDFVKNELKENPPCGIYGIFDSKTKECLYVGQSTNIVKRWMKHKNKLMNETHRKDFVEWFKNKNNDLNSIKFIILEEIIFSEENKVEDFFNSGLEMNLEEKLNKTEIKWFNLLHPRFYGKVPSLNEKWKHSENSRNNISESLVRFCIQCGDKTYSRSRNNCVYCFIAEKYFLNYLDREIIKCFIVSRLESSSFVSVCEEFTLSKRDLKNFIVRENIFYIKFVKKSVLDDFPIFDWIVSYGYSLGYIASIVGVSQPAVSKYVKNLDCYDSVLKDVLELNKLNRGDIVFHKGLSSFSGS